MLLMISISDFLKKIYDKLNFMSYIMEKEKIIDIQNIEILIYVLY